MELINNNKLLFDLYNQEGLNKIFSIYPSNMTLRKYKKDELISQPLKQLNSFLFIVQGKATIYGIKEDNTILNVASQVQHAFLGEMEFDGLNDNPFFVVANEDVVCISIPFKDNKELLNNDITFLQYRIKKLADDFHYSAKMNVVAKSLKERLIIYFQDNNGYIDSVNETMINLHCSRRQLQRVLKSLCDEKVIVKVNKGCYKQI